MPTALITGASQGLGRALCRSLAADGWRLIIDARHHAPLAVVAEELTGLGGDVTAIPGDIADPAHRAALLRAARTAGGLDLLVHNASTLGPTPLPALRTATADQLMAVLAVNAAAPLELSVTALPLLHDESIVLAISSDAAVEHYPGWGLYGAAKAALDHIMLTSAVENPELHWYAVDPGDMRTAMHQDAFPGEDISDRPEPDSVVPALRDLLARRPPSGRYRIADWAAESALRVSPLADRTAS